MRNDLKTTITALPAKALLTMALLSMALLATAAAAQKEPAAPAAPKQPAQLPTIRVPKVDEGVDTLRARQAQQLGSAGQFRVFHDFKLTDRQPESGLGFVHQPLPDGLKEYKMVHYDHGNGVVAADVDGDGRYDLYFCNQLGPNALWKNVGGGRFEDITDKAGVALADRVSATASFADYDNDGDPDLYVTTVKMGDVLFQNDGKGHFRDVTAEAGVGTVAHSSGAVFFDYDRDGLLDLFLTDVGVYTSNERGLKGYWVGLEDAFDGHLMDDRTETNRLFRNLGNGRFQDVSAEAGIRDDTWSGDAAFADLTGDGYPDLYVLSMQGDDRFYVNVEGKKFVDRTAEFFPKSPWGSMGVKFFDYNNDGRLDLMLTDMHSDMSQTVSPDLEKVKSVMTWTDEALEGGANNIFGNAFWEAGEDGKYHEVSDLVGVENYWPWGLSVGDLNADGYQDVFITACMNYPFRYGINSVLLNDQGDLFLDSEFILGVEPRRDGRTHKPWFTIDCSGADSAHDLCKGREGVYQVLGTLGSRSSVIFDLDGDGDQDVVTLEFNAEPQVLISNLTEKTKVSSIEVKLVGTKSNRDGLGALVKVRAGDHVYTQQNDGNSGYLSHSTLPLYFGLGKAEKVASVEVLWPSGIRQTVTKGLDLGSRVEIVEKASEEKAGE